jgi:hypothetical protein
VPAIDLFHSWIAGFSDHRPVELVSISGGIRRVWICSANAVHTVGMLFSFDLVLIDKDFKVVGLRELVRPFRITMPTRRRASSNSRHTLFFAAAPKSAIN